MEIVGESELRNRKREMRKDFVKSCVSTYVWSDAMMESWRQEKERQEKLAG